MTQQSKETRAAKYLARYHTWLAQVSQVTDTIKRIEEEPALLGQAWQRGMLDYWRARLRELEQNQPKQSKRS